jgi:conjugative transfer signal peptidase TraF
MVDKITQFAAGDSEIADRRTASRPCALNTHGRCDDEMTKEVAKLGDCERGRRAGRWPAGASLPAGLACLCVLYMAPLRLNLSSSMPVGWYLARDIASGQSVRRGTLVTVCLPAEIASWGRARGYLHRGSCTDGTAPVGKSIFAVAGDTVTVRSSGLSLNGKPTPGTTALPQDSEGRPLGRVPNGRYAVRPGEVWLISTYSPRSWDSRYIGPVPTSAMVSALQPLWIFAAQAQ